MLVIADSSPLHYLVEIGHAHVLPSLFSRVTIPPEVAMELSHAHAPQLVRGLVASPPSWLDIRSPQKLLDIPNLDLGERAAISLACELRSALLLIDERAGRQEAQQRNLTVIGTIGVLERAARQGNLDLKRAFELLRHTRFHVAESLYEEALRRCEQDPS